MGSYPFGGLRAYRTKLALRHCPVVHARIGLMKIQQYFGEQTVARSNVLKNGEGAPTTPSGLYSKAQGAHRGINAVCFYPSGRRDVTGDRDDLARIWNLDTGKEVAVWDAQSGKVISRIEIN